MSTEEAVERIRQAARQRDAAQSAVIREVVEAVKAGVPVARVADALGVTRQAVYKMIDREEKKS